MMEWERVFRKSLVQVDALLLCDDAHLRRIDLFYKEDATYVYHAIFCKFPISSRVLDALNLCLF